MLGSYNLKKFQIIFIIREKVKLFFFFKCTALPVDDCTIMEYV